MELKPATLLLAVWMEPQFVLKVRRAQSPMRYHAPLAIRAAQSKPIAWAPDATGAHPAQHAPQMAAAVHALQTLVHLLAATGIIEKVALEPQTAVAHPLAAAPSPTVAAGVAVAAGIALLTQLRQLVPWVPAAGIRGMVAGLSKEVLRGVNCTVCVIKNPYWGDDTVCGNDKCGVQ